MKVSVLAGAAVVAALGVRIAHSRHRRLLHPDGRSFTGELETWGRTVPIGSALTDRAGRCPVTVRISKGAGTAPGRADILGLAVRLHHPDGPACDLLLSTAGAGRFTRHVPLPRRSFDTRYGSILAYRTGSGRKVYLAAGPAPTGRILGRTLASVAAAAEYDRARLLLAVEDGETVDPFGTLSFGAALPAAADAALAFDPIRNAPDDLHPTGTVHGIRAFAYRLGQRWRGVRPAPPAPAKVAETLAHR
jgi:hypothetical protein